MRSSLGNIINTAEQKWLKHISEYVKNLFSETFIPSHDLSHHLRCWSYLKSIINNYKNPGDIFDENMVEALLLAALFHDTGMIRTFKPDHGKESRFIYNEFIRNQDIPTPVYHDFICYAIEKHDIKDHRTDPSTIPSVADTVLSFLHIADDLDAFGAIGVYRYTEIYLHRKIPLLELGDQVLQNVKNRFDNFQLKSGLPKEIKEYWKIEYDNIVTFFEQYTHQIHIHKDSCKVFSGPVGVVNIIDKLSISNNIHPKDYLNEIKKYKTDIFINAFFHKLNYDLNEKYC